MNFVRKNILVLCIYFISASLVQSQPLVINWQQCYGGDDWDVPSDIAKCGNGYLIVGQTWSNDGDISYLHGESDIWLVRVDGYGNKIWEKTYGGSKEEKGVRIFQVDEGQNYLIAGHTVSNDGDVTPHPYYPDKLHYWFLKIDSLGNILWDRTVGGNVGEFILNGALTFDKGIIGIGYTGSSEGDITNYYGWYDAWMIKINPDGTIDWDYTLGTSEKHDLGEIIIQTQDGGFLAGVSTGLEGNGNIICVPHSWYSENALVKFDSALNIEWQQCYGSSAHENIWDILETEDGYICCANTLGNDGDLEGCGCHPNGDIWIFEINFTGEIIWKKCYGGSNWESAFRILPTSDGSYMVFGFTNSHDGDISFNPSVGEYNYSIWIFKIDNEGELLWEQCIGGEGDEGMEYGVIQKSEDTYIISGYMDYSPSFDVDCSNHINGSHQDYWIFEMTDTSYLGLIDNSFTNDEKVTVFPNPTNQNVQIQYNLPFNDVNGTFRIVSLTGQLLQSININKNQGSITWDTQQITSGIYLYSLVASGQIFTGKIVIY